MFQAPLAIISSLEEPFFTFSIETDEFSVGRSSSCNGIIVGNEGIKGISRVHFKVHHNPATSTFELEDLSSNGTVVNNVLVNFRFLALFIFFSLDLLGEGFKVSTCPPLRAPNRADKKE